MSKTYDLPVYRRLFPFEMLDQGDPSFVEVPEGEGDYRFLIFTTGEDTTNTGKAIPMYGTNDFIKFVFLGFALESIAGVVHWAPTVRRVASGKWAMLYSRSGGVGAWEGVGDLAHLQHHIHLAISDFAQGPYTDTGITLTPDYSFSIDPELRQTADGLELLFVTTLVQESPYGVGIVAAGISPDLTHLLETPRVVAKACSEWQVFINERPFWGESSVKHLFDSSEARVCWYCMEGPSAGWISPSGQEYLLYTAGNYNEPTYSVGALRSEVDGSWVDISTSPESLVIRPWPELGIVSVGRPRLLVYNEQQYALCQGRFSCSRSDRRYTLAQRQFLLVPIEWDENDQPYAPSPLKVLDAEIYIHSNLI